MSLADGHAAEDFAARHLARQGLRVIERNYRCRGGEIDLVCEDGRSLVFVEVRLRRNARYGGAAASISSAKQARIVLAARHYLAGRPARACRFDCVLLDAADEDNIEWIRDAFRAE